MLRLITCVFFGFIAFFITNRVLAADVANHVAQQYEQHSSVAMAFDRLYSKQ